MILSMTGQGVARREDADLSLWTEVRSVNNRYLRISFRTPEFLSPLEPRIEQRVRSRLTRGAVTVVIHCKRLGPERVPPIDEEAAEGYAKKLKDLAGRLGLQPELRLADLLALPGLLTEESEQDAEPFADRVLESVESALDDFETMRRREGEALQKELRRHTEEVRGHLEVINQQAPLVVEQYRDRLLERTTALLKESSVELARESLLAEVSVFAERSDITEEVARLASHLDQFEGLLDGDRAAGRKLEFVAQEMLREANTIGAKAGDAEIGRRIVEVKAAVDRLKEQVQNVE